MVARLHSEDSIRYYRSKDAAKYCGYTESTFRTYRIRGNGPQFIKKGRTVLYDVRDLDAWIGADKRSSTSDLGNAR